MFRLPWLAALVAAIVIAPSGVRADATRVVLAGADASLARALEGALGPWGVDVLVEDASLGATMPDAASAGRVRAEERDAAAVVWVSRSEGGAALWMYDRVGDRALSRPLHAAPPYDEETAVAVALSIRALLRHSAAAPSDERIDVPALPTRLPSRLRAEIGLGAATLDTVAEGVEPRVGVGVTGWFGPDGWFGVSATVRGGAGVELPAPALGTRLHRVDAQLGMRLRARVAHRADLQCGVDVGATLVALEGDLSGRGRGMSAVEFDPTALVYAGVGAVPIDELRLAVRAGAAIAPRVRSWGVDGVPVLTTTPVGLLLQLIVEVPLDGAPLVLP